MERYNNIQIEFLIEKIKNRFDDIAEIHVEHPTFPDGSQLIVIVHSGEAESFEQHLDLTSADEVTINTGEANPLSLPFDMMATYQGPGHIQGSGGTTVYMAEDVEGAEPRELDTGIEILRKKLAGMCPICEEEVKLLDHYTRKSPSCREAERV
jgi:hypothetical protein